MTDTAKTPILRERLFSISEAARLLRITPTKLRRWLEGASVAGRRYPPVIRQDPTGDDTVTWAEFVEAALLREYRERVSLQHLRPIIDGLRREFRIPHPLAHFKPLVDESAREVVLRLQQVHDVGSDLYLLRPVEAAGGSYQVQWSEPVESFLTKVEFDKGGIARRMRPMGREDPVMIDPMVTFGIPQIRGLRTEILAEDFSASGGSIDDAARRWEITPAELEAALRWELSLKPRAA